MNRLDTAIDCAVVIVEQGQSKVFRSSRVHSLMYLDQRLAQEAVITLMEWHLQNHMLARTQGRLQINLTAQHGNVHCMSLLNAVRDFFAKYCSPDMDNQNELLKEIITDRRSGVQLRVLITVIVLKLTIPGLNWKWTGDEKKLFTALRKRFIVDVTRIRSPPTLCCGL